MNNLLCGFIAKDRKGRKRKKEEISLPLKHLNLFLPFPLSFLCGLCAFASFALNPNSSLSISNMWVKYPFSRICQRFAVNVLILSLHFFAHLLLHLRIVLLKPSIHALNQQSFHIRFLIIHIFDARIQCEFSRI